MPPHDRKRISSSAAAVVLAGQDGVKGRQEDLYRALHEHPELSGREVQTAATAAAVARDAGFEEVTLLAGS